MEGPGCDFQTWLPSTWELYKLGEQQEPSIGAPLPVVISGQGRHSKCMLTSNITNHTHLWCHLIGSDITSHAHLWCHQLLQVTSQIKPTCDVTSYWQFHLWILGIQGEKSDTVVSYFYNKPHLYQSSNRKKESTQKRWPGANKSPHPVASSCSITKPFPLTSQALKYKPHLCALSTPKVFVSCDGSTAFNVHNC